MKELLALIVSLFMSMNLVGCSSGDAEPTDSPNDTSTNSEEEVTEVVLTEQEPDVIVVGAGMAGLVSAVKSAELGADVLVIEQAPRAGGSALVAGGSISGTNFEIQEEANVEDSPEQFYEDFIRLSGGEDFNKEIAKKHTERSGEAIDWLMNEVGVDFGDDPVLDTGSYEPMNADRVTYALGESAAGGGRGFIEGLLAKLEEYEEAGKVTMVLETLVTDVIVEDGKIVGVKVDEDEVRAPSTIIATGGYAFSEEWLLEYNFDQVKSSALPSATGSGYDFARKAGAAFDRMDYVAAYPGALPLEGLNASLVANVRYPGAVLVNQEGQDVLGENEPNSQVLSDIYREAEDNLVYVIVAEDMLDEEESIIRGSMTSGQVDGHAEFERLSAEEEMIIKADTIEELAEKLGMDDLPATIEQKEQFENGAFYAIQTVPYVLMTQGGPRINDQAQLLTEEDEVIEGAFIAGEIIGSSNVAGNTTIGGMGHGLCAVWGMIAAEEAVANAQQ